MQQTTNYSLNKPDGSDFAKIQALNENADIIDTLIKALQDNKANDADLTELQNIVTTYLEESSNFAKYQIPSNQLIPTTLYTTVLFTEVINANDFVTVNSDGYFVTQKKGTYRITVNINAKATTSNLHARLFINSTTTIGTGRAQSTASAETKSIVITAVNKCDVANTLHVDFAHYDAGALELERIATTITIEFLGEG